MALTESILKIGQALKKQWFIIGIALAISLAHLQPSIGSTGGPLFPEVTIKYIAVSVIFLNSGLSLRTEDLTKALTHWSLHTYIQTFSLVFAPWLFWCLSSILSLLMSMDPWLINGFMVVGCMPPPVSSAVILTKAVGGNEAAAIFNSAFGSFLGIVVTPMWLLYLLGSSSAVPFSTVFGQLTATVVIPLVLGQMGRSAFKYQLYRWNLPYGTISSVILLLIIYTTFCDTFTHEEVTIDELGLLSVIFLIMAVQCCLLAGTFWLSQRQFFGFLPEDIVAILFCTTHKSLTLGIPMLKVVFADDPELSVLTLPLLVYHPTQILLGSLIVPTVRHWMHSAPAPRSNRSAFMKYV